MNFSNTYLELGTHFYEKTRPSPVQKPKLILWNSKLAEQLNIPTEIGNNADVLAQYFSGNQLLPGSDPIAFAYAGHQFGSFNPQLGDGRAHLLGEVIDQSDQKWELQLKGSGPTSFSRGGDGRCAIGPAVREFIMSESMKALGVPTTQCLAVVTTGESVYREKAVPGAVVTRVASSHLRVGTFEYFAARRELDAIKTLFDYAIDKHFTEISKDQEDKYLLLLDKIIEKQIRLIVEWMRVGFIHGVMNTDNTAISGETIDFGPCAMMGVYDPKTVYSSIDHTGRYAFGNQPSIAQWNLACLAECMLLVIDENNTHSIKQVKSLITEFPNRYQQAYQKMIASKLGILSVQKGNEKFPDTFLEQLCLLKKDYTITFDLLTKSLNSDSLTSQLKTELGQTFDHWRKIVIEQSVPTEKIQTIMRRHNPVVIPRNHQIETVIRTCAETGEASSAKLFLDVLRQPYKELTQTSKYQSEPSDGDQHYKTFCGT